MHKTRSKARRAAWYLGDNDSKWAKFNPVIKHKSKHKNGRLWNDVEGDIHRTHSESHMTPSIEAQRLKENEGAIPMTQHSNTMPVSSSKPSGIPSSFQDQNEKIHDDSVAVDDKLQAEDPGSESKPSSDDSPINNGEPDVSGASSTTAQPGVDRDLRKRFGKIPCLGRKESAEKGEITRTPSSRSQTAKPRYTVMGQLRATIFNSWLNVLFVFIPVGIAMQFANVSPVVVFTTNFVAIIPLAAMLSYATEEIAIRTGETIGGLLNATFGNAVELIVSIIALAHKEVIIVQTSLIGSMLSNLLLVLGMCFFFGGLNRIEQFFNITVAQTAASLLTLAVASLIIPAAFAAWSDDNESIEKEHITSLSRGTAILLLLVYGAYLLFQLKTHVTIYNEPSKKVEKRKGKMGEGEVSKKIAQMGDITSSNLGGVKESAFREPEEEKEQAQLSIWVALATLGVSTALVGVCAEFLVGSINDLVIQVHLSKTFVGLILLPIVGNAAEHATAVTVAIKDKMDLAIGVAIGSSMQIALLLIPFSVVLGWILGNDNMNLQFDGFQIATLFVSVLLVNYLISDGKSHWLEGILLNTLYLIIAVAAWYYPAQEDG